MAPCLRRIRSRSCAASASPGISSRAARFALRSLSGGSTRGLPSSHVSARRGARFRRRISSTSSSSSSARRARASPCPFPTWSCPRFPTCSFLSRPSKTCSQSASPRSSPTGVSRTRRPREQVGGLLHERSGSGQTVFVEPLLVVEDNNALQEAVEEEREEVHRILVALTGRFSARRGDLVAAVEVLTELDSFQARAEFSSRVAGVFPDFSNRLVLRAARHPLLDRRLADLRADVFGELEERHSDAVPLDLELPEGSRLLLLSGPNAGGKSVAMKTAGLFALLAQSGFAIPCGPGSTLPVFDKVLVVAGDAQDLLGDLSSFAAAMTRTARVLSL